MKHFYFRLANQFWSDPSFTSSYYEATFRPRAAQPHKVTLLIPNIFNHGETVPVNVPKSNLVNIYMTIFRDHLTDADIIEEPDDGQYLPADQNLPPEWYVATLSSKTLHFAK